MNEIEKVLKEVVYGSVGAVTTVLEVGGEIAKTFVEKGEEAVRQGQIRADELRQAMKDACDSMMKDPGIDVTNLTRAQRDELRRQLDEMDAAEEQAAQETAAESCEDCCADTDPEAEPEPAKPDLHMVEPMSIDVTYETGADDKED